MQESVTQQYLNKHPHFTLIDSMSASPLLAMRSQNNHNELQNQNTNITLHNLYEFGIFDTFARAYSNFS